jgi:hypothetical protein
MRAAAAAMAITMGTCVSGYRRAAQYRTPTTPKKMTQTFTLIYTGLAPDLIRAASTPRVSRADRLDVRERSADDSERKSIDVGLACQEGLEA